MNCDQILALLNDCLNKTLSEKEELLVKRHLEKCAPCRGEYYNLLHADKALRQVICEMVAEIDVPHGLSVDIEKTIAQEKRTRQSPLVMWLKTPLAAAALLFVVAAAVLGAYHDFNPLAQKQVARQVQDGEKPTAGALSQAVKGGGQVAKEKADLADALSPVNQPEDPPGQGLKKKESTFQQQAPTLKSQEEKPLENMQGIQEGQLMGPEEDAVRQGLNAPQLGGEQGNVFVTSAPPAGGGEVAAANGRMLNDETLAEKRTAIDGSGLDFVPVKPHYLPPGAVPVNVTSSGGEISQDYQAGNRYFTVRQSRSEANEQAPLKKSAQVANVDVVDVNGQQGFIEMSKRQDDHYVGTVTTLRWQQGDWAFAVSGDLPAEEIIKISKSLR
ncbi:MAG: DUF4367 domain-containing protein [Peptococcaceae bacterium]|nr:DUF4367 domain-containing protein [Peptococcaceae bacterium]